jgi:hypothetical protein
MGLESSKDLLPGGLPDVRLAQFHFRSPLKKGIVKNESLANSSLSTLSTGYLTHDGGVQRVSPRLSRVFVPVKTSRRWRSVVTLRETVSESSGLP